MRWEGSLLRNKRNAYRILVGKLEENIQHGRPKNRIVDTNKWRNKMGGLRLYKCGPGQGQVAGRYKNRNKPLGSLKYGESIL
jgi:hypothetical protein